MVLERARDQTTDFAKFYRIRTEHDRVKDLKWFGYVIRMNVNDFMKRVYEDRSEGEGIRGKQPLKYINRAHEDLVKKVAGKEMNRCKGTSGTRKIGGTSCVSTP